jgi:hypothetical protein
MRPPKPGDGDAAMVNMRHERVLGKETAWLQGLAGIAAP